MNYEIKVQGVLDAEWSGWLEGVTLSVEGRDTPHPVTTLAGPFQDQAALRGVLNKLWDLNLTLISVQRRETREESHGDRT